MPKTITLSVDDLLYQRFKEYARMDNRSLSSFFKMAASQYIENKILMDDFEMEEINSNIELKQRIRAGSRDAADKNGRFVD